MGAPAQVEQSKGSSPQSLFSNGDYSSLLGLPLSKMPRIEDMASTLKDMPTEIAKAVAQNGDKLLPQQLSTDDLFSFASNSQASYKPEQQPSKTFVEPSKPRAFGATGSNAHADYNSLPVSDFP